MNKQILAIDVGLTCGLAKRNEVGEYTTGVIYDAVDLWQLICTGSYSDVIIEAFNTSGHLTTPMLETIKRLGSVMSLCWYLNIKCHIRAPMKRRPYMEKAGKMLAGKEVVIHEKDALAHLLSWEAENAASKISGQPIRADHGN